VAACASSRKELKGAFMNSPSEMKLLLQRQNEIQEAMRRPGGIRITVERELYAIREQLRRYAPPAAAASSEARE
jgi:hypothetical protein